jgi:hypothetical protein
MFAESVSNDLNIFNILSTEVELRSFIDSNSNEFCFIDFENIEINAKEVKSLINFKKYSKICLFVLTSQNRDITLLSTVSKQDDFSLPKSKFSSN